MLDWLKAHRKAARKSQMEVALESYISQKTYCYIETGRRRPSVETAKLIAASLGFDWKQFFPAANTPGA